MTNNEVMERLSQTSGARVEKLIWIAASWENDSEIREFLDEVDASFYKQYMPDVFISEYFHEYQKEPIEALVNFMRYGFLAEIHLPKLSGFRFDGDKPVYWSQNPSYCDREMVYTESITDLVMIIETLAKARFKKAAAQELLASKSLKDGKEN